MLYLPVDDRISLKQIELMDAVDMFLTIDSQRDYLREWLPFIDATKDVEDSMDFVKSIYHGSEGSHELVFVIQYNGTFIGLIGFKDTDYQNKRTEIGYWLSRDFQKMGIMTQSVATLLDFAFDELNLNRVTIKCAVGNDPSKRIPQRLHFTLEGVERDGELLSSGQYTDLEVYSMLKRDIHRNFATK